MKLGTFLEDYADEIEDHLDMKKPSEHEGENKKTKIGMPSIVLFMFSIIVKSPRPPR